MALPLLFQFIQSPLIHSIHLTLIDARAAAKYIRKRRSKVRKEIGTDDHVHVDGTKICLDRSPSIVGVVEMINLSMLDNIMSDCMCKITKNPENFIKSG